MARLDCSRPCVHQKLAAWVRVLRIPETCGRAVRFLRRTPVPRLGLGQGRTSQCRLPGTLAILSQRSALCHLASPGDEERPTSWPGRLFTCPPTRDRVEGGREPVPPRHMGVDHGEESRTRQPDVRSALLRSWNLEEEYKARRCLGKLRRLAS